MVMKDTRLVKVSCKETITQWIVAYDVHTEFCLDLWRTEVEVLEWYA